MIGRMLWYLSMLSEHSRGNLRVLLDELKDRVGEDILPRGGKVHEGLEPGIRLAENTVTVSRNNTSRLERVPEVRADVFVSEVGADLLLHRQDPAKHFLGCETMQWAG